MRSLKQSKDEFVRLGTSSFLVSGDEKPLGVMYDLSIRPLPEAQDVIDSQYAIRRQKEKADKKKKKKVLGIFKKRDGSDQVVDIDDSDAKKLKLNRSSVLRVKVYVKSYQSIGLVIPKLLVPEDVSDDEKSQYEVVKMKQCQGKNRSKIWYLSFTSRHLYF